MVWYSKPDFNNLNAEADLGPLSKTYPNNPERASSMFQSFKNFLCFLPIVSICFIVLVVSGFYCYCYCYCYVACVFHRFLHGGLAGIPLMLQNDDHNQGRSLDLKVQGTKPWVTMLLLQYHIK